MPSRQPKEPTSFRTEDAERLRERSRATGRTVTSLVEQALEEFLGKPVASTGPFPDDFHPMDREQAATLANERGCAWYVHPRSGKPIVHFVRPETPLDEDGEKVLYGNTWSRYEVQNIVRELNRAHLLGLRHRS